MQLLTQEFLLVALILIALVVVTHAKNQVNVTNEDAENAILEAACAADLGVDLDSAGKRLAHDVLRRSAVSEVLEVTTLKSNSLTYFR